MEAVAGASSAVLMRQALDRPQSVTPAAATSLQRSYGNAFLQRAATRSAPSGSIQRDEETDVATGSSEDASRSAQEEAEGDEENKPSDDEKAQMERDSASARDQGAKEGEKEGQDQGADQENLTDGDVDPLLEGNLPEAPEPPPDVPAVLEVKSDDQMLAEQEEEEALGAQTAEGVTAQFSWPAVLPPDWDAEVAVHEAFMAALGGEDAQEAAAGTLPEGSAIQRVVADAPPGGAPTQVAEEPDPDAASKWSGGSYFEDDEDAPLVKVPQHENVFAHMIIGDTAGTAAEAINGFALIGKETNVYGGVAALIEALIKVTELFTNILGYISLALLISSGICYGLGAAFASTLILAPAAPPLFAAATFLMATGSKLGAISLYATVARMAMRVVAILFRALDYAYAKAMGASAEELRKKTDKMLGQAIGFAVDTVDVALSAGPDVYKSGLKRGLSESLDAAKKPFAEFASEAASELGEKAIKEGLKEGADDAAKAGMKQAMKEGGKTYGKEMASESFALFGPGANLTYADAQAEKHLMAAPDENATPADPSEAGAAIDEALDETGEDDEAQTVTLPAPPRRVVSNVNNLALDLGTIAARKMYLQQRLSHDEDLLVRKQDWQNELGTTQGELATNKQSLQAADQALDEQASIADQFSAQAEQAKGPAAEAKGQMEKSGGELGAMGGSVDAGMKRAESEGAGGSGQVDKATMSSGPSQGQSGAAQGESQAGQGVSDAQESKAKTLETKERSQGAQAKQDEASQKVADQQDENLSEMELLQQDREECLMRLVELEAAEEQVRAQHQAELETASGWSDEHKSASAALPQGAAA